MFYPVETILPLQLFLSSPSILLNKPPRFEKLK